MQLWTSEVIKPLSEIKIWLTIITYYYFCNHRWSVLKCCSIFINSFGYLLYKHVVNYNVTILNVFYRLLKWGWFLLKEYIKNCNTRYLIFLSFSSFCRGWFGTAWVQYRTLYWLFFAQTGPKRHLHFLVIGAISCT